MKVLTQASLNGWRRAAAAMTAPLLMAALAGCADNPRADLVTGPVRTADSPAAVPPRGAERIVLRFGPEVVPATLLDTPAAREFAAMLPLELKLRDPMGQAKSGRLSKPIDATADAVTHPALGGIYYAPGSAVIAIFYDDLGHSVPPPGLVRLGTVEADLEALAAAGNRIPIRIDLADGKDF